MECQECQERQATVHFTQVINGEKMEVHLCQQCAKEKGYVSQDDDPYSLHHLLSGLFHQKANTLSHSSQQAHSYQELVCDKCGMTYPQFLKIGKFGCAHCYDTFSEHLDPLFRKVHSGNTTHEGKVPKRTGSDIHHRKQLRHLKLSLQQAIAAEAFEEAARLRDQIKAMEKRTEEQEEGDKQ
ncbi:UvrB/UvrC motif-containing protein [Gracilibacillus alcaliphilus]|uniref:UvrB/UvrC motif-containing protein n=1 Tax=Gracilibacillus alcaliphilus TaxID=1401441 RepID=UPI00195D8240|nr:protein arginine kinase activator [Gracilibacillus alcaliphilus]